MKILHVNDHLDCRGGVETYLLSLMPRLEAEGDVQAVAYGSGSSDAVRAAHHVVLLGAAGREAEARAYLEMREVIAVESPDVIHVHNVPNIGAIRACLDSAPTVLTAHDYRYVCPASSFYYRKSQKVCGRVCGPGCFVASVTKRCLTPRPVQALRSYRRVRWIAANAGRFAAVIAPSDYTKSRLVQAGFPTDRILTLPYFCPIEPLAEPRPAPAEPVITFMGRISENKGYRYFLTALGLLPDVRGLLIGSLTPEKEQNIKALAQAAGCAERLECRPWASRDAIRGIMAQTSVFVFPSLWPETLGIVGLEALSSGVPVVASDIGGVREWLYHERTGLLVPPKDSHAIAAAVRRLLDRSGGAHAMGCRGIDLIAGKFGAETHLRNLAHLYGEAVKTSSIERLAQVVPSPA